MILVGFGVLLLGYSTFAYGWSQVRGCNAGFLDLFLPGRNPKCDPDTGGSSSNPVAEQKAARQKNCPSGYVLNSLGVCAPQPSKGTCPPGWIYDPTRKQCVQTVPRG